MLSPSFPKFRRKMKGLGKTFQCEERKKEKKMEEEKGKGKPFFSCCVNPFSSLDDGLVSLNFISRLLLRRSLWGKVSKNLTRKVRDSPI